MTTNEELSQTLNRLHEQLSRSPQLDEATVQSLRILLDDIEAATARSEAIAEPESAMLASSVAPVESSMALESQTATSEELDDMSLSQRMRKAVDDFESRHPQLTVTLSQIADTLAEMGI